jgi:hypothetical protein
MQDDGWTRLRDAADRRFRLQRAALLEYARATLPTRLSRRVVHEGGKDPSAMPAEIWQHGNDLALVWHVRHERAAADSAPRRVVGFVRQTAGHSIQQVDLEPGQEIPASLGNAEPVKSAAQFWQSDRLPQPPAPTQDLPAEPAGTAAPVPSEPATPPGSEEQARITRAQGAIDVEFRKHVSRSTSLSLVDFELTPTATPEAATNWRLQDDPQERQRVATLLERARVCNFRLEAEASERMVLLEREVPFYKGCRLYRVIDMRGPRSRFASFVLHLESADLAALYTQSAPIHAFNARRHAAGELVMDEASVAAYLRFFCEFVQGDAGAFSIIESPREIRWLSPADNGSHEGAARDKTPQRDAVLRRVFTRALQPVALYRPRFGPPAPEEPPAETETAQDPPRLPGTPPPALYARVFLGYGRYLFAAGIAVGTEGSVEMFADSPLHGATLPIQPLSFNVEFQFRLRTDAVQPDLQPQAN